MTELTISVKTLTPLWTGGVDQTCDRLHETGLIGSLTTSALSPPGALQGRRLARYHSSRRVFINKLINNYVYSLRRTSIPAGSDAVP
jgi:hypothetical protein